MAHEKDKDTDKDSLSQDADLLQALADIGVGAAFIIGPDLETTELFRVSELPPQKQN